MCKSQQQHRMSENKRWWQWTKIGSDHSGLDNDRSYHDRVILARRGDCLFEEKAVAAQIEGAKALIVQNTDVSLM